METFLTELRGRQDVLEGDIFELLYSLSGDHKRSVFPSHSNPDSRFPRLQGAVRRLQADEECGGAAGAGWWCFSSGWPPGGVFHVPGEVIGSGQADYNLSPPVQAPK